MTVDNSSAERPDPGGSSGLPPLARRRLIKSAIGTPVVLSSLASKPVLGGQHGCGPSNAGSPSPNSHSPEAVNCSTLGLSAATWKAAPATSWPSEIKKGPPQPTDFNGFGGLNAKFYKMTGGGRKPASMLEVLSGDSLLGGDSPLGRATVVSLLNAYRPGSSYPVTPSQIVQMFNAASTLQDYPVGSGMAKLTPQQVLDYLESLYPKS